MRDKQLFFELIQVAIGERDCISRIPNEEEWLNLYDEAIRQSLVGVLLSGVEKLNNQNEALKPPIMVLYKWLGNVSQIEMLNKKLNNAAAQLNSIFINGGVRSCVLKGQGLATLYPVPQRRQTGDIDLWVEGKRINTIRFLKDNYLGMGKVVIHHVKAHIIEGVESEIHFMPIWLYNPIHNSRLQRFFREKGDEQFSHLDSQLEFCYPTEEFNGVYILVHIFHHLLYDGIVLRQVMDYYYVLKKLTDAGRERVVNTIDKIGCRNFAGALMFVMGKVFAFDRSFMICEPNANKGKRLLAEIMTTGNFGQYDERFIKSADESAYTRNKRKSVRWLQLAKDYPSEVLCIPAWKLWHWCWRKWKGYNRK